MHRKIWLLFFIIPFNYFQVFSQTPQALSSADILLGLKKLKVLGSVLYVAAHPDDENTRLLAYFAKEKQYLTGYLSLTRGDGGQNLIGNEQGVELGLIRTQELLSARRMDGAEQFFSRAFDFGFSKSTEEALKFWDHDKILGDIVWVIRKFQPDVIITRFPQDSRAGHGHHSASAVLAVEAYTAAADPSRYPEQLKFVKIWQAKRILWNTFNFGGTNTTSSDQYSFDVGGYNPILGKSYGEIAAESRSQHKSQGFGVARQRGQAPEFFSTWKGEPPVYDLMDGVTTSWDRLQGTKQIGLSVDSLLNQFSLFNPGKSVRGLVKLYDMIAALPAGYWREQKLKEVQQLIEGASGLWMEATTSEAYVVQSDSFRVNFFVNNRNGNSVQLQHISLGKFDSSFNTTLESNRNFVLMGKVNVPDTASITQPYWLKYEMKEGSFDVRDQLLIGNADNAPAYVAKFSVLIEGHPFTFSKPVQQRLTDPVKGELYEPLVVVPPVLIQPSANLLISTNDKPQEVKFTFRAMKNIDRPVPGVVALNGWKAQTSADGSTRKLAKGDEMDVIYTLTPPAQKAGAAKVPLAASATLGDEHYSTLMRTISYDHIPAVNYFRMPTVYLLSLDLKTAGKHIGFIEGAGDYMPTALRLMGYQVTILTDHELADGNLSQYDAILTGVRAYNIKESLQTNYDKLMRYVQQGGNLIVQYNTSSQIGPLKARIGPYPFNITRTRITDEHAVMKMLQPADRVLNFPNKIQAADFEGWVQERSIYHAADLDPHYRTVFSMNDPGEPADEGSTIIAGYGKGNFVYTGLVFYRELPAGVPGAYRLLANMIALNQQKGF